jgi:hypothetical protein
MIPSVLRIAMTWLALSATAVLVMGCGGGGHTTTASADAPITKAQAVAYAHAVNLRAADVPGFSSHGYGVEPEVTNSSSDAEYARCAGIGTTLYVGQLQSPQFGVGIIGAHAELVSSKVQVLRESSLAIREVATFATSRGRSCFAQAIQRENSSPQSFLKFGGVSWSHPALPVTTHRIQGEDHSEA